MFDKLSSQRALAWAKKIKGINLLGTKCQCGADHPIVLEFHHSNQNKENTISALSDMRWSKIEEELKKCELLCSNCHTVFHFNENSLDSRKRDLKLKLLDLKGSRTCSRCRYDKPCSLDFHHLGDKKFEISSYIFWRMKIAWEDVLAEIDKCEVLCRNCHKLEHYLPEFTSIHGLIVSKMETYKERPGAFNRATVFSLYDRGISQTDIAKTIGCRKSTICMMLKERIV